ncbi:nicotinate-nucleotide--dimethylbenzimidazole phosphoribosyltransferase [Streptomyces sp. NPDC003691]
MSRVNLDDFSDLIGRADGALRQAAEDRRARLAVAPGGLGRLDELGEWLVAAQGVSPPRVIERPKVVLFAGDHGVAGLDVSGRRAGEAYLLVREVLEGTGPVAVLARAAGVPVRIVDAGLDCDPGLLPEEVVRHRIRRGSGRIDIEDALTADEVDAAVRLGAAIADQEADAGTDLIVLGDLSVGGTTPAAVLIAALCGTDASVVTGRGGAGIDDLAWMRKCAAIRDALRRARPVLGDQMELLAAVGGADIAAMTGFLLQCAVRRTPVILDGVVSAACALVGQRAAFRAPDWWLAGQLAGEPGQAKALDRMALNPLLEQGVTTGGGTGALLALPLVRAAAALLAELPERAEQVEPEPAAEAVDGDTGPAEVPEAGTTDAGAPDTAAANGAATDGRTAEKAGD